MKIMGWCYLISGLFIYAIFDYKFLLPLLLIGIGFYFIIKFQIIEEVKKVRKENKVVSISKLMRKGKDDFKYDRIKKSD